ncbi:MAG: YggU family protein [Candidatus Omnitrophica bacterium]|nr:YggU family protein [Candidatus Omnitrophota bacterium]MBI5024613.1 YggU family protein [Candidatus Omnitrophota bacterium]
MKIEVKVIPSAKKNAITQEGQRYKIHLNAPAVDGKANEALVKFLAEHFQVRKNQIEITKGLKSRHKVIIISDI